MKIYDITPYPKPRPRVTRNGTYTPKEYQAFKQEVRLKNVFVAEFGMHIIFIIPMPKSWSKKKKAEKSGQPHKQRPDKDNLEKALLDALYDDDSTVWDSRVSKVWGKKGAIAIIEDCGYSTTWAVTNHQEFEGYL